MALRYQSLNVAVPTTGTTFAHGLTGANQEAIVPNEWHFSLRGIPLTGAELLYLATPPSAGVNPVVATYGGSPSADVFFHFAHSEIR